MIQCENVSASLAYLDWYQARREQAIPTVSVLVGTETITMACWQSWCAERSYWVLRNTIVTLPQIIANWLTQYHTQHKLMQDIKSFFVAHLGDSFDILCDYSTQPNGDEIEALFRETVFCGQRSQVFSVFSVLIEQLLQRDCEVQALWEKLSTLVQYKKITWETILQSLLWVLGKNGLPALLFYREKNCPLPPIDWLNLLTGALERISSVEVKMPIAVVIDKQLFETYRTESMESRGKAILCETVLALVDDSECQALDRPETVVENLDPLNQMEKIEELARSRPASTNRETFMDEDVDRARSIAERLLYEALKKLPQTSGLFQLNETIDIAFGQRLGMEVDLICKKLKLSIEVDGYYHFQDQEAYRRDRRKDLLLQRHGYLVLRFLADDVSTQLDKILDTILEMVQFRLGYHL